MVVHNAHTKKSAREAASKFRKMGFKASIFQKKDGKYKLSVTRK